MGGPRIPFLPIRSGLSVTKGWETFLWGICIISIKLRVIAESFDCVLLTPRQNRNHPLAVYRWKAVKTGFRTGNAPVVDSMPAADSWPGRCGSFLPDRLYTAIRKQSISDARRRKERWISLFTGYTLWWLWWNFWLLVCFLVLFYQFYNQEQDKGRIIESSRTFHVCLPSWIIVHSVVWHIKLQNCSRRRSLINAFNLASPLSLFMSFFLSAALNLFHNMAFTSERTNSMELGHRRGCFTDFTLDSQCFQFYFKTCK